MCICHKLTQPNVKWETNYFLPESIPYMNEMEMKYFLEYTKLNCLRTAV